MWSHPVDGLYCSIGCSTHIVAGVLLHFLLCSTHTHTHDESRSASVPVYLQSAVGCRHLISNPVVPNTSAETLRTRDYKKFIRLWNGQACLGPRTQPGKELKGCCLHNMIREHIKTLDLDCDWNVDRCQGCFAWVWPHTHFFNVKFITQYTRCENSLRCTRTQLGSVS